jgi:predicted phosphodiesterase
MGKRREEDVTELAEQVNQLRKANGVLSRKLRKAKHRTLELTEVTLAHIRANPHKFKVKTPSVSSQGRGDRETAMLHLSDTQIGKLTESYDAKTCRERVIQAVEKSIEITNVRRNGAKIDELVIFFGGDLIEGEFIFPHQPFELEMSLGQQATVVAPEIFAEAIALAAGAFRKVRTVWVAGNHGRAAPRGTAADPNTNWDTVVARVTKGLLYEGSPKLAKRVEFDIVDQDWYRVVDIEGWRCLVFHGHQVRGSTGIHGHGFYKKVTGWVQCLGEPFDYTYHGHFHTPSSRTINDVECFQNGTTESDNGFAMEELACQGFAAQRLQFFNKTYGVISDCLLRLDDRRKPAKSRR